MLYEQQCLLFLEYVSFEMVRNLNCDYMVIHVLRENSNMTRFVLLLASLSTQMSGRSSWSVCVDLC